MIETGLYFAHPEMESLPRIPLPTQNRFPTQNCLPHPELSKTILTSPEGSWLGSSRWFGLGYLLSIKSSLQTISVL